MSKLTRDGTAEPVSRDQILRHARGQGNVHFPCSADHEQDWQPYPVDPYSAICDDHTYIHTLPLQNVPDNIVLVDPRLLPLGNPFKYHIVALYWAMNGQKREYPVLFWPKTDVPENNSGRECCWPYLIGQHPLSPVFGQKRPGTPGNSYFAQLPPVLGHFMFLSGGLLDISNRSTWATRTNNMFSP